MLVKNVSGGPLRISEIMKIAQPNQVFDLPYSIASRYRKFLMPVPNATAPAAPVVTPKSNNIILDQRRADYISRRDATTDPLLTASNTTVITSSNIAELVTESAEGLPANMLAIKPEFPVVEEEVTTPVEVVEPTPSEQAEDIIEDLIEDKIEQLVSDGVISDGVNIDVDVLIAKPRKTRKKASE